MSGPFSSTPNRIVVACDHAGFELKRYLLAELKKSKPHLVLEDLGTNSTESCDYPDFAAQVGKRVASATPPRSTLGILVCGSGIGMEIAANKIPGVRAANVSDVTAARLAREHNDANVLCLGQRLVGLAVAWDCVISWLDAEFKAGRHQGRIDKIATLEKGHAG